MKLYAAALSIFCMMSLFAIDTVTPTSVDEPAEPVTLSSLDGISCHDASVALGTVGISYWFNYKFKGFIKDLPDAAKGIPGGLLPRFCKYFDSKDFVPTIAREAITAATFAAVGLGLKVLIADNLISTGAQFTGDGKAIKSNSPAWFEKAWTTGTVLAFGKLFYDMYSGSLAPDLLISFKKLLSKAPTVTPATT